MKLAYLTSALLAGAGLAAPALAAPAVPAAEHQAALDILTRSIAFPTVAGRGQMVAYAEYLKGVLVAAGYRPDEIEITPMGDTATLVARYPGSDRSKKPIVINCHMDVVEAVAADWERDPFKPVVENGYVFGRGAADNKFDLAMVVETLATLRRQGWKPKRDVILALTGDEETQMATARALAAKLKGAEYVLNGDGGGGVMGEDGKPIVYRVQAGEKTYADYTLTVTDPGGHSSRPGKTNAIVTLARALERIGSHRFPAEQNALTQAYFKGSADKEAPAVAAAMRAYAANPKDAAAIAALRALPEYVGQVGTTCVVTQVAGGHATNALPQKATANVNCRIFPGTSVKSVQETLTEVAAEPEVAFAVVDSGSIESPVSPLRPDVVAAVTSAVHASYPGLAVVPNMSAGATDSMHFRASGIPSYGVSGLFLKASDDYSHGLNERVPVSAIDPALIYWKSLLTKLAG